MPKIILFLLVFYNTAAAQKKSLNPSTLDVMLVKLKDGVAPGNLKFPVSFINVIDARYDTSKIGFILNKDDVMRRRASRKIMIAGGLANAAAAFYNNYYKDCLSTDSLKLLVVIKKLWADPQPNRRLQKPDAGIDRSSLFDVYARFEFLLQKGDKCFPIKRVDTLFQWPENVLNHDYNAYKNEGYSEYEYALIKMLESCDLNLYSTKVETLSKSKAYQEVLQYNQSRFNFPVLNDSIIYQGVYLTFQEFKNNKPSIEKYTIRVDRKAGSMIFRATGNDSSQIIKYWGFCDGKNVYFGDAKYPLVKAGHTFEFFNDLRFRTVNNISSSTPRLPALLVPVTYAKEFGILEPFQLDMDTGKIY